MIFEIVPENYIGSRHSLKIIKDLSRDFIIIPHAVDFSLGSVQKPDRSLIDGLAKIISQTKPAYWSEHISFSKTGAHDIGHLSPVPFNENMLEVLCENIDHVKKHISCPLILENITYSILFKNGVMQEVEFLNRLHKRTQCGLLLDVTNLFINSKNHGFDAFSFIDELNADAIAQLHIIGYEYRNGTYFDTHGEIIQDDLWDLYRYILEKTQVNGVIIEWDRNFPDNFEVIMDQLRKARSIWKEVYKIA